MKGNCLECKHCRKAKTRDGTPIHVSLQFKDGCTRANETYFCMGGHGTYLAPIHLKIKCNNYEKGTPRVEIIDNSVPMGFLAYPPLPFRLKEETGKKNEG